MQAPFWFTCDSKCSSYSVTPNSFQAAAAKSNEFNSSYSYSHSVFISSWHTRMPGISHAKKVSTILSPLYCTPYIYVSLFFIVRTTITYSASMSLYITHCHDHYCVHRILQYICWFVLERQHLISAWFWKTKTGTRVSYYINIIWCVYFDHLHTVKILWVHFQVKEM